MAMITNLQGRLRNTDLPRSHGLLPLFEAVANSIQAIGELGLGGTEGEGTISITIVRDPQTVMNYKDKKVGRIANLEIVGFKITDDGVGFNERNVASFKTLDSDYKVALGGRGVGRLLWLKAFQRAEIESYFLDEDQLLKRRAFTFSAVNGVDREAVSEALPEHVRQTTIQLVGFDSRYRSASPKTARSIANSLLEHCLWYFIRPGGAPTINLIDDGESIAVNEAYEEYMATSATDSISVKGVVFDLVHVKLRSQPSWDHSIALCAANRVVKEEKLRGRVAGLHATLVDEIGAFGYQCYVTSDFLDDRVRSERTAFDISEKPHELLEDELSLEEIHAAIAEKSAAYLAESLKDVKQKGRARIDDFVSSRAPRYRPILNRLSEAELDVDPAISDKELELKLHEHWFNFESRILNDGHDLMQPYLDDNADSYGVRLREYLSKVEDIKASDLASYVSHRKVVIDLLAKALQRDDVGKYRREDAIHQLIMPMRVDSNSVEMLDANLWLIDERLAFHNYLASDKAISSMPITNGEDRDEPDLCCLQLYDNPLLVNENQRSPLGSITIVEIKRPMRNDAAAGDTKDPIEQALKYLRKIRSGGVKTATGRPIANAPNVPGYCYILCDLTPTVRDRCELGQDLIARADQLGYYGYRKNLDAYVEVVSFDLLVNRANEKNRAFFERLGLPGN